MFFHLTFALLLGAAAADLADIADVAVAGGQNVEARNPKLFFVSSTTSTVSTTTLCYMDASTKAACGKRKRRRAVTFDSLNMDGVTRVATDDRSAAESEVENGHESMKGTKEENEREGKFLLYWMTTTSTSTTYTATTTISSLECTPSGFTISTCTG